MPGTSHAFSQQVPAKFRRDMGYSEPEFYRLLNAAIGDYQYTKEGQNVSIEHPEKANSLQLSVIELPDRVLGAFRIKRVDVQFFFQSFSAAERTQFMQRFDSRYQRGGG